MSSQDQTTKSIVIRLPRNEAKQLRVLAVEQDSTVQALVASAIRQTLLSQAVKAAPTETVAPLPKPGRTSSSRRVILTGAALEAASRPHVPGVQHTSLVAAALGGAKSKRVRIEPASATALEAQQDASADPSEETSTSSEPVELLDNPFEV